MMIDPENTTLCGRLITLINSNKYAETTAMIFILTICFMALCVVVLLGLAFILDKPVDTIFNYAVYGIVVHSVLILIFLIPVEYMVRLSIPVSIAIYIYMYKVLVFLIHNNEQIPLLVRWAFVMSLAWFGILLLLALCIVCIILYDTFNAILNGFARQSDQA